MSAQPGQRQVSKLTFTGDGGEYFRIWITNLLLTLVTLGIYSAWAKVRKASYFRNNTSLDGHVFGYHGNPRAILRGRVIALVLVAAYSWAFDFSRVAGDVTIALLCGLGPWLFARGQQFALVNTSYRGLRFGFHADFKRAYASLLPLACVWFTPELLRHSALKLPIGVTPVIVAATWPWMHHQLKAYQHGHARYGKQDFSFEPARARFYLTYGKGIGVLAIAFVLFMVSIPVAMTIAEHSGAGSRIMVWTLIAFSTFVSAIVVWPYYAARVQQLVWQQTALGHVRFHTNMQALPLAKLALKNVLLTLVTGGLYWPWASIALARYRLESVQIESDRPLSALAGTLDFTHVSATGEGTLDMFDLDIGL